MAEVDFTISQWLTNNMLLLIAGFIVILVLSKFGKTLSHRYFAWLMNKLSQTKDFKYDEIKKDLFKPLNTLVSNDPELRKENAIKILEVGVGTGVNFEFYPPNCRLVVVDPNPFFAQYYNDNRSKFPNIHSSEIIVSTGEEMDMVKDNSVDVVITTLVLCSVQDIPKLVAQVYRVLTPGGKFFFIDHIKEFDSEKHWMRLKLQEILTYTRIWPTLFDGCCLDRDMFDDIKKQPFSKVDGGRTYAPIARILFNLIKPHLIGVATK